MTNIILKDLNEVQKEAVCADWKPLLIVAGAGSGKTRILTRRIAFLISSGVPAFQILGITFTNKAAEEMERRVKLLINQHVWIATFHATCLQILRMDGEKIGLKRNFSIYDETDQLVLIKECMKDLGLNERQINPKAVRECISRGKDGLETPQEMSRNASDFFEESMAKIYELYNRKLESLNACDFGDLIAKVVMLFGEQPVVLEAWQDRFRHVLVDEYQDTNHAQYVFVNQIASQHRQITVVGDPDQSIYAWRGADIQNILRFEVDFPECRLLKLEQNYRSTQTILEAANTLIRFNNERKPKNLWTANGEGELISLFEASDEKDEAAFVVRKIRDYKHSGRSLKEMVVFYRLHSQSRVLEDELRRSKINYKIIGGVRFYDRREIKDLVAYLRVIASPEDELSLKRIVNVPTRGIGKKCFSDLQAFAAAKGVSLFESLKSCSGAGVLPHKAESAIRLFIHMIERMRMAKDDLLVSDLLHEIINETAYLRELEMERTIESKVRIENIKEFFSAIQEFEESWEPNLDQLPAHASDQSKKGLLEAFLEGITLQSDADQWDPSREVLSLMTLHCAKGLEFPIVFMVGLEEEIFPHINSLSNSVSELEEERRLCYVGMTRAKEKLFFSFANSRRLYGFRSRNLPSRFLNEIPSHLFEEDHRFGEHIEFEPEGEDRENHDMGHRRRILYD